MWQKLEALLDSIIPAVETEAEVECNLSTGRFSELLSTLATQNGLPVRSAQSGDYVLEVPGSTIGGPWQLKTLFGKAEALHYDNAKSRLRCFQTESGVIKVVSYEHLVGLKKEKKAFRDVLNWRLSTVVSDLDRLCRNKHERDSYQ